MKAVILAAGKGTRMKDITKTIPKPMVTVKGKPMLEHIVEFIKTNKNTGTIPVGGLHKHFFNWDRDTQNEYMTSLFNRAKKAGKWICMDTGGIPETVSKETYDFFLERIGELAKI